MAQINEAESLKVKIERHQHFDKCLEYNAKNEFYKKKNELNNIRNNFNDLKSIEIDIINAIHNKTNSEKELNNLKAISEKDLENLKIKLDYMEEINLKKNESELSNLKDSYNNFQLEKKFNLEQLDKEISNLKIEIDAKKESLNSELDLKKKEEIYKLKNDFNILIKKNWRNK